MILFAGGILLISAFHFSKWGFTGSGTYVPPGKTEKLEAALLEHVKKLSVEIPKNSRSSYDSVKLSAEYIRGEFKKAGYRSAYQEYKINNMSFRNISAIKEAANKRLIIIGAHYDAYFNPGADDNMSSVAVLLETAKAAFDLDPSYSVNFVAFVNEEPPNFRTDTMGSYVYARNLKEEDADLEGAIILECVGFYSDKPASQTYPPLFGFFYPNKGNFLALISNFSSSKFAGTVEKAFKGSTSLPLKKAVTFDFVPGVDFSDNWGFWKVGYPAVMLTDTAFFRNPNYHSSHDTFETLDYQKMSEIVTTLTHFIETK